MSRLPWVSVLTGPHQPCCRHIPTEHSLSGKDPCGSSTIGFQHVTLFVHALGSISTRLLGLLCLVPFLLLMRVYVVEYGFDAVSSGHKVRFAINTTIPALTGWLLLFPTMTHRALGRWRSGAAARLAAVLVLLAIIFSGLAGFGTLRGFGLSSYAVLYASAMLVLALLFAVLFILPGPYGTQLRRLSAIRRGEIDETGRPPPRNEAEIFAREMEARPAPANGVPDWVRDSGIALRSESSRKAELAAAAASFTSAVRSAPSVPHRPARRAAPALRLAYYLLSILTAIATGICFFASLLVSNDPILIPKNEVYHQGDLFALPLTIILTCLFTLTMIVNHRIETDEGRIQQSLHRRLIIIPLIAVALFFVSPYVISNVAPTAHAFFYDGPRTEIRVAVLEKERYRARRRCRGAVIVGSDAYGGPSGQRICDLDEELHRRLFLGDTLVLSGVETPYGFVYDDVHR